MIMEIIYLEFTILTSQIANDIFKLKSTVVVGLLNFSFFTQT